MTYLTWFLFNANSNSFKFCSIGGIAIGSITLDAHLMAGREALSGRQALPVAVFFILHFFEGREFADRLIHGMPVSIIPGGCGRPSGDAHISKSRYGAPGSRHQAGGHMP